MPIEEIPIKKAIEAKIAWAENCCQQIRDLLFRAEGTVELLRKAREAIHASQTGMAEAGVVDECKDCEEREGGSCCGAGLENKYGGVLLLINVLLGVKLPKQRYDPSSCFFLGQGGCLLLARHVICVNYLCKKITDRIDPQKIAALREKEGMELELLFHLQERIKKILLITRSNFHAGSKHKRDPFEGCEIL
jgi:hypothetical protein